MSHWVVLKFGGTSVAGRARWDVICDLARRRRAEGLRVLLVCSAVAGVTNRLAALADRGLAGAGNSLAELIQLHRDLGRELGVDDHRWLPQATTMLEECFATLQRDPGPAASAALLAAGEWLSTRIGCQFLRQQGLEADWVDAREACDGVKTVTCQQDMAVMLLQNRDTRRQVGFLADVFEVFRRHGVSVDGVATSETTTTVSLNKEANHLSVTGLDELERDPGRHCSVRRFDDCVCANLVGRGARTALSRLAPVMRHFDTRPLLMVSQSANDLCLSLLVPAGAHRELLQAAHAALVPDHADGVFGATWNEISCPANGGEAAPR